MNVRTGSGKVPVPGLVRAVAERTSRYAPDLGVHARRLSGQQGVGPDPAVAPVLRIGTDIPLDITAAPLERDGLAAATDPSNGVPGHPDSGGAVHAALRAAVAHDRDPGGAVPARGYLVAFDEQPLEAGTCARTIGT